MRAFFLSAPAAGLVVAASLLAGACSAPSSDTCAAEGVGCTTTDSGASADSTTGEAGDDGGNPETGGDSGAGPDSTTDGGDSGGCNTGGDPSTTPCLVSETYGVFVSPTGNDSTGDGSRKKPYATITKGVAAAKTAGKRVYACAGTYAEKLTLDAAHDGVDLAGGFSCSAWTYAASNAVLVAPTETGPALTVNGLTLGATVQDVTLQSVSATAPGDSSIAVWAVNAKNVAFRRVTMKAGDGAPGAAGADGTAASNYNVSLAQTDPSIAGNNAVGQAPGGTQSCASLCANAVASSGGKGGDGDSASPGSGLAGGPSIPPNPAGYDGAGGTGGAVCGNGHPGASASDSAGGGPASALGSMTASGWSPSTGNPGTIGNPGQGGGGGGGGISSSVGGGGGGGCGGCGGSQGRGGGGGGSSIALLSFSSLISLDACTLTAGNGMDGGRGGAGQPGQVGGNRGSAVQNGTGCNGGAGGTGGAGGGGGGGTGGMAVGIAYTGKAPNQANGTNVTYGTSGKGGAGGGAGDDAGPSSNAGQKGLDGVATAAKGF